LYLYKKFSLKKANLFYFILLVSSLLLSVSCTRTDIFEKNIAIPKHAWSSDFMPVIEFEISDSTTPRNIYIVVRHADAYRYKNMWVNVKTQAPTGVVRNQPLELKLANDSKGWLGSGMDDIFEHRILITPPNDPKPLSAGKYTFTLTNIMREDPLEHVMNMGIRVEAAQ
jgi:gliding motility-associated lipoprotein GldH